MNPSTKIKIDSLKGRYLSSCKNIGIGECIIQETPIIGLTYNDCSISDHNVKNIYLRQFSMSQEELRTFQKWSHVPHLGILTILNVWKVIITKKINYTQSKIIYHKILFPLRKRLTNNIKFLFS